MCSKDVILDEEQSKDSIKPRHYSVVNAKGEAQWTEIMRMFSEDNKERCRTVPVDMPTETRGVKKFPTGSKYSGTWDILGMSGYGTYKFPHGVVYEGEMEDGMFHGEGELRYQSGAILRGTWKHGVITQRTLIFGDGLEYTEVDWKYCRMPDRRFTVEYDHGMNPAGRSYLTADQPTKEIPPGYYDTGDGFYDPETKVVYRYHELTDIVRSPSVREQKWIVDNCRTTPDLPVGPRKELYEEWVDAQLVPEPRLEPATPSRGSFYISKEQIHDADFETNEKLAGFVSSDTLWKNTIVTA